MQSAPMQQAGRSADTQCAVRDWGSTWGVAFWYMKTDSITVATPTMNQGLGTWPAAHHEVRVIAGVQVSSDLCHLG